MLLDQNDILTAVSDYPGGVTAPELLQRLMRAQLDGLVADGRLTRDFDALGQPVYRPV